jgi:hypothetical protein
MFSVNIWGSKPGTNDDCWTGRDFADGAAAFAAYNNPATISAYVKRLTENSAAELWIEIVGPGVEAERQLHAGRKAHADISWRREIATEAGMAHGLDAYNDMMGCA